MLRQDRLHLFVPPALVALPALTALPKTGFGFIYFILIFFFLPLTPAGQRDDHGKGERVCVLAGPWGGPLALRGLRAAALW